MQKIIVKSYCKKKIKEEEIMIMRLFKRADVRNFIGLPKKVAEKFGKEYYMEIYEDKIVLIPVKKGE